MTASKWPFYSRACQRDMQRLLQRGGGLSPYRSNPAHPVGPARGTWAWRLERLAERVTALPHVIATNSGTMALYAALRALDPPPGAEIVTSPYTFSATAAAILHAGLRPVFMDVDAETACIVPVDDGRLYLPVDLFGYVPDYASTTLTVEDACQAVGGWSAMGRQGGAQGYLGAWSFNGQKNVPAGEAGAIVTRDPDLAFRARRMLSHGENWGWPEVGLNGRLNEPTALIAYHGMRALWFRNEHRRRLAQALRHHLANEDRVRPLTRIDGHALYVYPLLTTPGVDRRGFVARLNRLGVTASEGYLTPHLGEYPAFRAAMRGPLPVTEELSRERLVLLYQLRPPVPVAWMRYVARAIRAALDATTIPRHRGQRVEVGAY